MNHNKLFVLIISIWSLLSPIDVFAKESIASRYNVLGGRGAETSLTLIGDLNNKTPINYYLSYNACVPEDVWMVHFIPWTTYPVEIPSPAKVLIKTFTNNTIELPISYSDDGIKPINVFLKGKPVKPDRYVSGVHCKVSYEQLLQILKGGVYKIRIQTVLPNGYIERVYDNNSVSMSLQNGHDILLQELKPIDIYDGF